MSSEMLLHCGGKPADLQDLRTVPMSTETKSYKPVGHYQLVLSISEIAGKFLRDYEFDKGLYALSVDGQRMFGLHTYGSDTSNLSLAIGFRNSYNKSLSVGVAIGACVLVCDNLAFRGDITVLRKHTSNIFQDLELMILRVMYHADDNFDKLHASVQTMQSVEFDDDKAYQMLGLLFGRGVLSSRQLSVAKREWLVPRFEEFMPRNAWTLHNAATAALKSTPPNKILERHIQLHNVLIEHLGGAK